MDRIAVALKAAEIISGPRRAQLCAATMLGTGKNMWQAEIDVGAEMPDFLRFGSKYAAAVHAQQPADHSAGAWNRLEYRGLEGFVAAISPFNFLAIGCNLVSAPMIHVFSMLFVPFHHDHFRLWLLPLWATSLFGNRVIRPY